MASQQLYPRILGKKYEPIIKGKGFCPNPVAVYGIPDYANGKRYPNVIGTLAWEEYWYEEWDRMRSGYTTGGIFIPGRYYYYLNHTKIYTVKRGFHYPDFVDLDLEYFSFYEYIKSINKGMIMLKGRRRGISEKTANGIFGYNIRMREEGYVGGVVAGLDDYTKDFKLKTSNANLEGPIELTLMRNGGDDDDEHEFSWQQKNPTTGQWEPGGSRNRLFFRTAFNNENVFKGKALDDCVFEEAGEFMKLDKTYGATQACFKVGKKLVGTPLVYGTGGNVKSSSKAFKKMLAESEYYDLIPYRVYGDRLLVGFFVGSRNEDGEVSYHCPNIKEKYSDLSEEQLLGCEDTEAAEKEILTTRKKLSEAEDRQKYYDYFQDNPLNDNEAFLSFSANNYNPEKLATQALWIIENKREYDKYTLDFKKNPDGTYLEPLQIEAKKLPHDSEEKEFVYIRKGHLPVPGYKHLYCAGIDSYDQDESAHSKSLGAMCVFIRDHSIKGLVKRAPIAIIRMRPKRKEIFYRYCVMLGMLYNTRRSTLIDAATSLIIKTFEEFGQQSLLAFRPSEFDAPNGEQNHRFGVKLTTFSKPKMIGITQTYIEDECDKVVFPLLIKEWQEYDQTIDDSDWDLADAFGIALMQDIQMTKKKPTEDSPGSQNDLPYFVTVGEHLVDSSKFEEAKRKHPNDLFLQLLESGAYNS